MSETGGPGNGIDVMSYYDELLEEWPTRAFTPDKFDAWIRFMVAALRANPVFPPEARWLIDAAEEFYFGGPATEERRVELAHACGRFWGSYDTPEDRSKLSARSDVTAALPSFDRETLDALVGWTRQDTIRRARYHAIRALFCLLSKREYDDDVVEYELKTGHFVDFSVTSVGSLAPEYAISMTDMLRDFLFGQRG